MSNSNSAEDYSHRVIEIQPKEEDNVTKNDLNTLIPKQEMSESLE